PDLELVAPNFVSSATTARRRECSPTYWPAPPQTQSKTDKEENRSAPNRNAPRTGTESIPSREIDAPGGTTEVKQYA
ncbi:hypothetical protein ACV357_36060, partial [Pseudomonas aeruginosa]